jgi:hypothetical protein
MIVQSCSHPDPLANTRFVDDHIITNDFSHERQSEKPVVTAAVAHSRPGATRSWDLTIPEWTEGSL